MAAQGTIKKLSERIDAIAERLGKTRGPLWCVCETLQEGRAAVERHLADNPHHRERLVHIVATGVPSPHPCSVREMEATL
jgi:hypothetical protein